MLDIRRCDNELYDGIGYLLGGGLFKTIGVGFLFRGVGDMLGYNFDGSLGVFPENLPDVDGCHRIFLISFLHCIGAGFGQSSWMAII